MIVGDNVADETWLEDIIENDDVVDNSWLEDTAEKESAVGARAIDDELAADNSIESAEPDDETEAETILLNDEVPEDDVMDEIVEGTMFEAPVKPGMDEESHDDITEMEEAADKPPLDYGGTYNSTGDVSLVEDINVVADPLEVADVIELETPEKTGDTAEDKSGVESRLLFWT